MMAEITWATKPKIFTIPPFLETSMTPDQENDTDFSISSTRVHVRVPHLPQSYQIVGPLTPLGPGFPVGGLGALALLPGPSVLVKPWARGSARFHRTCSGVSFSASPLCPHLLQVIFFFPPPKVSAPYISTLILSARELLSRVSHHSVICSSSSLRRVIPVSVSSLRAGTIFPLPPGYLHWDVCYAVFAHPFPQFMLILMPEVAFEEGIRSWG